MKYNYHVCLPAVVASLVAHDAVSGTKSTFKCYIRISYFDTFELTSDK
jgi:hypothetical protein